MNIKPKIADVQKAALHQLFYEPEMQGEDWTHVNTPPKIFVKKDFKIKTSRSRNSSKTNAHNEMSPCSKTSISNVSPLKTSYLSVDDSPINKKGFGEDIFCYKGNWVQQKSLTINKGLNKRKYNKLQELLKQQKKDDEKTNKLQSSRRHQSFSRYVKQLSSLKKQVNQIKNAPIFLK